VTFLEHPAHFAQVRADPALLPAAIEEPLRYDGPTSHTSAPLGPVTSRDFAFPRRVSSIPKCFTGGVAAGSAACAAAVNAAFAIGQEAS
jgi:hypothetical protein